MCGMDELFPHFRAEAVCAVTGWNGALLRTRRTRSGLFPATKQEGATPKWTRFSFVDLCQARIVAKLDNMGFGPDDAVETSKYIRPAFRARALGHDHSPIAVVRGGLPHLGNPHPIQWALPQDKLADLQVDNSDLEVAVIVDCAEISRTVRRIILDGGFYQDQA